VGGDPAWPVVEVDAVDGLADLELAADELIGGGVADAVEVDIALGVHGAAMRA
jgi:hypothetical protein